MLTGVFLAVSLNSCEEKKEEKTETEELIDEMNSEGADVKYKEDEDGSKLKMETEDTKVKIKTDEDGDTKVKIKETTDGTE